MSSGGTLFANMAMPPSLDPLNPLNPYKGFYGCGGGAAYAPPPPPPAPPSFAPIIKRAAAAVLIETEQKRKKKKQKKQKKQEEEKEQQQNHVVTEAETDTANPDLAAEPVDAGGKGGKRSAGGSGGGSGSGGGGERPVGKALHKATDFLRSSGGIGGGIGGDDGDDDGDDDEWRKNWYYDDDEPELIEIPSDEELSPTDEDEDEEDDDDEPAATPAKTTTAKTTTRADSKGKGKGKAVQFDVEEKQRQREGGGRYFGTFKQDRGELRRLPRFANRPHAPDRAPVPPQDRVAPWGETWAADQVASFDFGDTIFAQAYQSVQITADLLRDDKGRAPKMQPPETLPWKSRFGLPKPEDMPEMAARDAEFEKAGTWKLTKEDVPELFEKKGATLISIFPKAPDCNMPRTMTVPTK